MSEQHVSNPGAPVADDGLGCHAGREQMLAAAAASGNGEMLQQYARDYPMPEGAGPHDQPQSMCPAFGSLRVGLRMRRTATVLSGSACCVYGLSFTAHFYGARRSIGYVPFSSETLVTGKLFEDIREAVYKMADPALYDTIIVTNLCVPTASGVSGKRFSAWLRHLGKPIARKLGVRRSERLSLLCGILLIPMSF